MKVVDAANKTIDSKEMKDGEKYLALFLNAQEYGVKILQDLRASWHMCIVLVEARVMERVMARVMALSGMVDALERAWFGV